MQVDMLCDQRVTALGVLEGTYGERVAGHGLHVSGQWVVELWRAADGATFTVTLTSPQGLTCVVAAGRGWEGWEPDYAPRPPPPGPGAADGTPGVVLAHGDAAWILRVARLCCGPEDCGPVRARPGPRGWEVVNPHTGRLDVVAYGAERPSEDGRFWACYALEQPGRPLRAVAGRPCLFAPTAGT